MHLIFELQLAIDEQEAHRSLLVSHSKCKSVHLSTICLNLQSDLF
jgi:hypothetical protein